MFSRLLDLLSRYQLAIVLLALVAGLIWPGVFLPLNPWNGFLLQVIMFATGLRLDWNECARQAKDWRTLVLANSMMLVLLPFLVSLPLAFFAPEWTLPFVLAAAMPTGLTAPTVVALLGGRTSLAILISVSTSVLAPFAIPLVLRVMAGQRVTIDVASMMANIAWVVIVPLVLSALVQWKTGRKRLERLANPIRLVNLAAFALVIASVAASSAVPASGVTAPQDGRAAQNGFLGIGADGLIIVILMTIFWLGIAWLASAMLAWRDKVDRMTVAFCLIYMNTTLGVWIADKFFHETGIAPKLVAIFIATTIILPIFKWLLPTKKTTFKKVYAVEQI